MNSRMLPDITRITLAVLFIAVLIASCFWTLKPFLLAIIWAAMIVIATWPMLLAIQSRLGGKRGPATLVMTLLLLAILIVPLAYALTTAIQTAQDLFSNSQAIANLKVPPPPQWLHRIPLAGEKAFAHWQEYSSLTPAQLSEQVLPYSQKILSWFIAQAGSVGMTIVHCFLTVIIAAIFYSHGEAATKGVMLFVRRLAGQTGEDAALLAAKSIRGVALGIVGTALTQSVLGGVGLLLAGVPAPFILSALLFLLCAAQIGPTPVLIPAAIWLFYNDMTGWGIFMIVLTVITTTLDNFIRPVLIRRGADLPLLLILAGVVGGLLSFGIIGLFIGPVMLAVTFTLLKVWVAAEDSTPGEIANN